MASATIWGVVEVSCSNKGILEVKKAVLLMSYICQGQVRPLALLTRQHLRCSIARCAVYIIFWRALGERHLCCQKKQRSLQAGPTDQLQ